jgi:serine palmitoyltransferase
MIIGSLAGPLCAGGGFCAGSSEVVEHQRISSTSYTFSAALPAVLATQASETVRMLHDSPELIIQLKENIKAIRAQLDPRSDWVRSTSAAENPIQLLVLKDEVLDARKDLKDDPQEQEKVMQEIVDEVLANGVLITRLKSMPQILGASARELQWNPKPALKVCVTTGLSKKETEKAGIVIRHAITKIMSRRK